jgi:hypothetical protein
MRRSRRVERPNQGGAAFDGENEDRHRNHVAAVGVAPDGVLEGHHLPEVVDCLEISNANVSHLKAQPPWTGTSIRKDTKL